MAKKPASNNSAQMWVRIVCGIMGFLMVFGVLVMLISTLQSAAVENGDLQARPDQQISVGLYCNENAVQSYTVLAEQGIQVIGQKSGISVELDSSKLIAAVDNNLYRTGNELSAESGGIATVGGYHIEISYFAFSDLGIDTDHDNPVYIRPGNTGGSTDGYAPANVDEYIELLSDDSTFNALNLPTFPYYATAQKCYIRIGNFFTAEEAEDVLVQLARTMTLNAKVVSPDDDTITLLSEDWSILCELAGQGESFRIAPRGGVGLREENGRIFSGNIVLSRPSDAYRNGISVVNQLSLEAYVAALLPSAVSSTWSSELLKTMAVVLRTDITRKLGCHAADGYDICGESHCHVYIGGNPASDRVTQAVEDTAGQILTYEDQPIYAPYSMENGNGTISAKDAFGKDIPYLPATYTPWEASTDWTVEFTPYELYQLLNSAGYDEITGNIASIRVNGHAPGSDYVNSISFTDLFGSTVTVNGSEAIRILFAGRLPSTCFVAGRSGDSVTYTARTLSESGLDYTESSENLTLGGTYGSFVFVGSGNGCGVGLSVMGARALAERGMTYEEILACYFPGTVLTGKGV